MFVICIEAIMYLLLYNLHECTFKPCNLGNVFQNSSIPVNIQSSTFRLFKWFTVQKMETGYTSPNVKSTAFVKITKRISKCLMSPLYIKKLTFFTFVQILYEYIIYYIILYEYYMNYILSIISIY